MRIGIDVGGTFTDFVLTGQNLDRPITWKEPGIPTDPAASVLNGLSPLLSAVDANAADVEGVVHGATLALNAVIQRRGARVGLIVSQGFGDMLTLRRGGLPQSSNYKAPKPEPLVPRPRVHEIPARLRPDGSAVLTPTAADIDQVAEAVLADKVDALAVVVINSYAHPKMESDLAAALRQRLPGVLVTASAELWPEVREFERALVTVMNGYIHPLMDQYYSRLADGLAEIGLDASLDIATSTGGVIGVNVARVRPVETLVSGPAAGVSAAARLAAASGVKSAICFDMGGTSSDIAVVRDGTPEIATETQIEDHPLILPVIGVTAIGAGGGSLGWVDPQGVLKVGPESAGADPGPACYGKGGADPTVTDAWLALGYLNPHHFLGGRMQLDAQASSEALARLGAKIDISGEDAPQRAAAAMMRIATARMATEIGKAMAHRGVDPADFTLIAYGGAGPTQAAHLASAARLRDVIIAPGPATFCAFGAVSNGLRRDFSRSNRLLLADSAAARGPIAAALEEMQVEARAWAEQENRPIAEAKMTVHADMQYPRTAIELSVEVKGTATPETLTELFHAEHERLYGFRDMTSPVHLTTLRLTVGYAPPEVTSATVAPGETPAPGDHRHVQWEEGAIETPVYPAPLPALALIPGPALIELSDATVVVPPGWQLTGEANGAMRLTRTGV